jgi:hypothetical protein
LGSGKKALRGGKQLMKAILKYDFFFKNQFLMKVKINHSFNVGHLR